MITMLRSIAERVLGRGAAAITVPVFDGALKPNRALDEAEEVASIADIDDLASDGHSLWVSAGTVLYVLEGDALKEFQRFPEPITALAARREEGTREIAVALSGTSIQIVREDAKGPRLGSLEGRPLTCVNSLAYDPDGNLYFTEGSSQWPSDKWCFDLMHLGATGRACVWPFDRKQAIEIESGLGYAYGVLSLDDRVLVSESWRHHVLPFRNGRLPALIRDLPAYPSRMSKAAGGGFWLSCFTCRTQLVEFVLREPEYRQRMIREIDPRYWIAPSLASGRNFLEPLQGAGVKQMGILKPWAPPRSYGLVIRVSERGELLFSLHSRVDGRRHGITAIAEHGNALYVVSKGAGKLLRTSLHAPKEKGADA